MVLMRVGPLSAAKLSGGLYLMLGLVIGIIVALVSVVGSAIVPRSELAVPFAGALFGVGAVVIFPLLYGAIGFLGGLLMAALYNLAARFAGGVELDLR